jgi:hypothetical protein
MEFYEKILNKKVTGVYHEYILNKLHIHFENGFEIEFDVCVIVFDLGIIGHSISHISNTGTLGMAHELKKHHFNLDDFKTTILSRDINDIENKNEMIIAYKSAQILKLS